jgi:hypothetical protein
MEMNYASIKQLAKETEGTRIADLVALAPQNDPFSCGTKGQTDKAEWFRDLYHKFGISDKVHLRRIHYWAVSQPSGTITKPNGTPYENTDHDWEFLIASAKYARYLGLVDMAKFEDKRNTEPVIRAWFQKAGERDYNDPTPSWELINTESMFDEHILPELPTIPDLPDDLPTRPAFNVKGYDSVEQPFLIEIWCEKSTMEDIIHPLCRTYRANYCTGRGELSISMVKDFLDRCVKANRPARILYVSDYDPAGLGMPVSIARKVEWFIANFTEYADLEVKLEAVVMTADQVASYNLPRKPVKDSDMRKANWIKTQGAGAVELDALEALYPGQLCKILVEKIECYYDRTLYNRAVDAKNELEAHLEDLRSDVKHDIEPEYDALSERYGNLQGKYMEMQAEFEKMIAPFQERIDAFGEELDGITEDGEALWSDMAELLEERANDEDYLDLEDFPVPDPELTDENPAQLYDSARQYLDQLLAYKQHRGLA